MAPSRASSARKHSVASGGIPSICKRSCHRSCPHLRRVPPRKQREPRWVLLAWRGAPPARTAIAKPPHTHQQYTLHAGTTTPRATTLTAMVVCKTTTVLLFVTLLCGGQALALTGMLRTTWPVASLGACAGGPLCWSTADECCFDTRWADLWHFHGTVDAVSGGRRSAP